MADEAVIIAGALDSKELEKSIDAIINTISSKSEHMADPFTNAIGKMEQAMKNFAITQKVSASTMKDAWREMSASFDAMFAAQSASNGGGNGSGNSTSGVTSVSSSTGQNNGNGSVVISFSH